MERTKFIQVVFVFVLMLKNLSVTGTGMGKQAGYNCESFKVPPSLVQQLMSVPLARNYGRKINTSLVLMTNNSLQKVKEVVDCMSWLMNCPNCIRARVDVVMGWSTSPKALRLTERALVKADPLLAMRGLSMPENEIYLIN